MMPSFNNIPNTFTVATPSISAPSVGSFVPTFQFRVPSIQPRFSVALPRVSDYIQLPIHLQLPNLPTLICSIGSNFDFGNVSDFFQTMGSIPGQIQAQISNIPAVISGDLKRLNAAIKAALDNASAAFTATFDRIKSYESMMMYKAREFAKNIENYLYQLIINAIVDLINALGLPNPLAIPIPYLTGCVVGDIFTLSGRNKIKNAIILLAEQKALGPIIAFLAAFDASVEYAFNGKLGDTSLEYQVEEIWSKIMSWVASQINNFIQFVFSPALNVALGTAWNLAGDAAAAAAITDPTFEPLAGYCYAQVGVLEAAFTPILIDPTVALEASLNQILIEALNNAGKNPINEMNHVINEVLNFPIPFPLSPLVGASTMGGLIGINLQNESFKYKFSKVELLLLKLWDLLKQAFERLKRLFVSTYNLVVTATFTNLTEVFGYLAETFLNFIISNIPILGTVYTAFTLLESIFNGTYPACTAMTALAPELFELASLIKTILSAPSSAFKVNFSPYGLLSREKQAILNALNPHVSVGLTVT